MKIKKGDRLRYTGGYATYPPGTVVAFCNYRTKVTVLLDGPGDYYADWPVDEVEEA